LKVRVKGNEIEKARGEQCAEKQQGRWRREGGRWERENEGVSRWKKKEKRRVEVQKDRRTARRRQVI